MSRFLKNLSILLYLTFIFCLLYSPSQTRAQLPDFSIASSYTVTDPDLADGDIVSLNLSDSTLKRSASAYDETMHGVYLKNPKIAYYSPGNDFPIARTGEVNVNVTTFNGEIKVGDYISSSEIPGKGMKATDYAGYMLGVSLANFTATDGAELIYKQKSLRQGQVKVVIGIGPASPAVIKSSGGFLGTVRYLGSSLFYNVANSKQAEKLLRIILAVIIAVTSIALSIHFFGKNVTKGIESIGRNPLAKSAIQTMIVINIILIASIAIGGIIIALVIISL